MLGGANVEGREKDASFGATDDVLDEVSGGEGADAVRTRRPA